MVLSKQLRRVNTIIINLYFSFGLGIIAAGCSIVVEKLGNLSFSEYFVLLFVNGTLQTISSFAEFRAY